MAPGRAADARLAPDAILRGVERAGRSLLAAALLLATAADAVRSQEPATSAVGTGAIPASFFPCDYEGEILVDYARLREIGLLDRLERLPMMQGFLLTLAATYWTELDDLLRVRTALVFSGSSRPTVREISMAETAADGRPAAPPAPWQEVRMGALAGWRRDGTPPSESVVLWPRPGVTVVGPSELLAPLCAGERRGGVAHPDLLPLLAGRDVLFQVGVGRFGRRDMPFQDVMTLLCPEPGEVELARLRLAADADERLHLSIMLRFASREAARRADGHLEGRLGELHGDPRFASLVPLVETLLLTRDGADLVLRLDLGGSREAMRTLERIGLSLMRRGAESRRER